MAHTCASSCVASGVPWIKQLVATYTSLNLHNARPKNAWNLYSARAHTLLCRMWLCCIAHVCVGAPVAHPTRAGGQFFAGPDGSRRGMQSQSVPPRVASTRVLLLGLLPSSWADLIICRLHDRVRGVSNGNAPFRAGRRRGERDTRPDGAPIHKWDKKHPSPPSPVPAVRAAPAVVSSYCVGQHATVTLK